MTIHEAFQPSLLLSETHFPYLADGEGLADAAARAADEGFYRRFEMVTIGDLNAQKRIGEVVRSHGLSLTQWFTLVIASEGLNLSSLDETLRAKSIRRLAECLEQASECGAMGVGVPSGPDPGSDHRAEATEQLYMSLCELCESASGLSGMAVYLEPFDRGAHKNGLIGPMSEAVAIVSRVRRSCPNMFLCWDSAHSALNGEQVTETLAEAQVYVGQIHLSNAVLDRRQANFGDHHMRIGRPGFLTVKKITELFDTAVAIGLFGQRQPTVAVETRSAPGDDPWATVAECTRILKEAWKHVGSMLDSP